MSWDCCRRGGGLFGRAGLDDAGADAKSRAPYRSSMEAVRGLDAEPSTLNHRAGSRAMPV